MIVKVCGVRTPEVAEAAVAAGADWIGLVLEPRSPRFADGPAAAAVVEAVGGRADLVGVVVEPPDADECENLVVRHHLSALQVHGTVTTDLVAACPVAVIPGINVASAQAAFTLDWYPDALLLLDSAPGADGGLPGGTGRRLPLQWAADVARHRRIILAGGLGPDTVAEAVLGVRPAGVDASSGLETAPGVKDPALVTAYVRAARQAEASV